MLGFLLGPVVNTALKAVTGWWENKQALKAARQASELKWAETMAKATETSWKDELITVVILSPVIAAMLGFPELGERAFAMMKQAPQWYQLVFMTVVSGSFGINILGRWKKIKNGPQPIPAPESRIMDHGKTSD